MNTFNFNFIKWLWEKKNGEEINVLYDIEDYIAQVKVPTNNAYWVLKKDRWYKFITDNGIYFIIKGKVYKVYSTDPNEPVVDIDRFFPN